jgi:ABC-type lipoprotein release transport system permease subunit
MTDLGIDADYGTGPLARLIKILPLPITVKQGLSNITIKKSRQAFTIITLAVAVGAFMGIFAVFESFNTGIGLFLDSFNVDVGVFPNERRNPEEVESLLLENFGPESDNYLIESIAPGFQYQVEFEGYDPVPAAGGPPGILAYGYNVNYRETNQGNAFNFEVSEGEEISDNDKDNAIMLSSSLSLAMDREVGNTVVMKVPGSTKEFEVVAIIDFPIDQVWLHWETLARMTGYTFDTVRGGSGLTEQIPGEARRFIRYSTVAGIDTFSGDLPEEMTAGLSQMLPEEADIPENAVNVYGITAEMLSLLTPAEGYDDSQPFTPDENTIILSDAVASQGPDGGYQLGDEVQMTSLFGEDETFTVAGVYDLPPLFGESIPPEWVAMDWQALGRFDNADITSVPIPQGYFMITTIDEPTADDLDEVNDQINEVFSAAGISAFYLNFVQLTEDIAAGFLTIQAVLTAVALLIALVGALGLLTTLSMSVFERQKEIGVMRSIGASSSTIALQFLTEGLVVGFIAWLVGIPLGYLIEVGLLSVTGFDETFPAIVSISGTLIGLVGILAISAVASIFPALGAARKTVSNILRYQ